MLTITVPARRLWDEKNEVFLHSPETQLMLEHSLISVSKWESKWKIPFLSKDKHEPTQMVDYVRCMTLNKNVDPLVYLCLTDENYRAITDYINANLTATTIKRTNKPPRAGKTTTSELIYYWMVSLQIPFEPCEKWHLSRLMALIEVADAENNPKKKKMSTKDIYKQNDALNAARRAKMHSSG